MVHTPNPIAQELDEIRDLTAFALARLVESRDTETGQHLLRMRAYSVILADQLSRSGPYQDQIDDDFLSDLYRCSPLHDIGKVAIPDSILLKPGRLTNEEFELMKRHTTYGAEVFWDMAQFSTSARFLSMAAEIALYHHERFDGKGYPTQLKGRDIPLAARIVSVADAFDAITSERVYKEACPNNVARSIIVNESGQQFDPVVVDAFEDRYESILEAQTQFADELPYLVGATESLSSSSN